MPADFHFSSQNNIWWLIQVGALRERSRFNQFSSIADAWCGMFIWQVLATTTRWLRVTCRRARAVRHQISGCGLQCAQYPSMVYLSAFDLTSVHISCCATTRASSPLLCYYTIAFVAHDNLSSWTPHEMSNIERIMHASHFYLRTISLSLSLVVYLFLANPPDQLSTR